MAAGNRIRRLFSPRNGQLRCRLNLVGLEDRTVLSPVANAGLDLDTNRGNFVTLNGLGSSGNQPAYTWTQVSGPDVTGKLGTLSGAQPTFVAPTQVSTLEFDLVVSDSTGTSNPDRVVVSVFENHLNALFVSPTGSSTNPGTRTAPLANLADAIAKAQATSADVYVAAGTYAGSLALVSGVSVYGGFAPGTWLRDVESQVTTVAGGATAVVGQKVQDVILNGLTIQSADATSPGGNSIALAILESTNILISDSVLLAGAGANGSDGVDGAAHANPSAPNGNNGQNGTSGGSSGGFGGSQVLADEPGGRGGDGGYNNGNGQNGSASPFTGTPGGNGGIATGQGFQKSGNGQPGFNGSSSPSGNIGAGGVTFGSIVGFDYIPSNSGADGNNGINGKGGGGGGGGGGGSNMFGGFPTLNADRGGGGGSGGAGGLGGKHGQGGLGGGGSIAILVIDSSDIIIFDNAISTAQGGNGGRGGNGAAGQLGGEGGQAGLGFDDAGSGGKGGNGGMGGAGGPGGGGGGGPSVAILTNAASSTAIANNTWDVGMPGLGGLGGTNPAFNFGGPGHTGTRASYLVADSAAPTLTPNLAVVTVNEGSPATNGGTFDDLQDRGSVTITASIGAISQDNFSGIWSWKHAVADGPSGPMTVTITATDDVGNKSTTTFTLTVANVAPTATFAGPDTAPLGTAVTFNFTGVSDPSSVDLAGLKYSYDFTNDGTFDIVQSVNASAKFTYTTPGTYSVRGRVEDKDGGFTDYATKINVVGPPQVQSLLVNDGSAQRSMVTSLKITFSEAVSFPSGIDAAFQLNHTGPGNPIGPASINAHQLGNTVTLTLVTGGSLTDGTYKLSVFADKVSGTGGLFLDGNGDGSAGDHYVNTTVHRLFGDVDGDRDVDAADFGAFRAAFGGNNFVFDFDYDGDVDTSDFGHFRARYGMMI